MTAPADPPAPSTSTGDANPPGSRIAFDRLRERTDELELIVSGLLAFALLAMPGRIFDAWAANVVHVEGVSTYALMYGFMIGVGFSYTLGFAFLLHLAIRGYWIALIGLKSTFPSGIRWDRVPFLGPVSRPFQEARIGDLGHTIDRVDRVASILFAMAILFALTIVWSGALSLLMVAAAGLLGMAFGDAEHATLITVVVAVGALVCIGLMPLLVEKIIVRRQRTGHAAPGLERLARRALRVAGWIMPQRLILPVQMTLQSNLHSRSFMAFYYVVVMLSMLFGAMQIFGSSRFSVLHGYDVLTAEAVDHGMVGAHYESLRSEHDRLLRYPMIPADRISEAHLRLFLPHRPQIDNALARETCTGLVHGRNQAEGPAAAAAARDCLAALWTITLDGEPVALADFVPTERRDLGMRGLTGYLPLSGRHPGRHDLVLVWHPEGGEDGPLRRREYRIPFWFSPGIDQRAIVDAPPR